jgi:hypothetical protein
MKDSLHRLYRRRVEVVAHGISYSGVFLGADEDTLYMIGPTSYITIPLEAVSAVRPEGAGEEAWLRREVEGEPRRRKEEAEEKRRYSRESLSRVLDEDAPREWPEKGGSERKK